MWQSLILRQCPIQWRWIPPSSDNLLDLSHGLVVMLLSVVAINSRLRQAVQDNLLQEYELQYSFQLRKCCALAVSATSAIDRVVWPRNADPVGTSGIPLKTASDSNANFHRPVGLSIYIYICTGCLSEYSWFDCEPHWCVCNLKPLEHEHVFAMIRYRVTCHFLQCHPRNALGAYCFIIRSSSEICCCKWIQLFYIFDPMQLDGTNFSSGLMQIRKHLWFPLLHHLSYFRFKMCYQIAGFFLFRSSFEVVHMCESDHGGISIVVILQIKSASGSKVDEYYVQLQYPYSRGIFQSTLRCACLNIPLLDRSQQILAWPW